MKRLLGAAGAGALLLGLMLSSTGAALATVGANTQYWTGNGSDAYNSPDCKDDLAPGQMLWIWTGDGTNVTISVEGQVVDGFHPGKGASDSASFHFITTLYDLNTLVSGSGGNVWVNWDGDSTPGTLTISHICPAETTSSSSSSSTTTFSSTVESTTDSSSSSSTTSFNSTVESTTDTQPPTDTIGSTGSGQQSSILWLLVAGLGAVLGSVVVLAPAKKRQ